MKMKRTISLMAAVAMVATMFAGCNTTTPATPGTDSSASPSQGGSTTPAQNSKVVVYSNSTSNGQDVWLYDEAKKAGFDLEIVSIDGSALADRMVAEKNKPLADVVFGLNAIEYQKLKANDLLLKYTPSWAGEVDMTLGDPEGFHSPIIVQPLVLIYNKDMQDAPKDWTDLADSKYADKFNIFALASGTSKTVLASILVRYRDDNGELGISNEGWDIVKKYYENAHIEVKGEDYIGNLISGERPMTMLWGGGVIKNAKEREYDFTVMQPEIGMPYVVEQIAVVNGTKNEDAAKAFIDWFGSEDVQVGWSTNAGAIPVNPKALDRADPATKEFMAKCKSQSMDWAFIAENVGKWVEKVELEFVK